MRIVFVVSLLFGCGSNTNGNAPNDLSSADGVSCDTPSSGSGHICTDYQIADASTLDGLRASCSNDQGTLVSACSHRGASGGCMQSISSQNGAQGTQITWYYDQTAAQVMSNCGSGTFVQP